MTPVEAYNQLEELLLQLDLKKRKDLEGYNFRINTLRLLGLAIQKANTSGPGGNLEWGDISGVLLDQTDLAAALNNKAGLYHTHHANDSFYDNNASGLTADDVQEAITELKGIIDALPTLTVTEENSTPINEVDDITIIGATVTNEGGGKIKVTVENSPTLTVTGGDVTVDTVDNITFTGATVIDDGSGDVTITIDAGSSITVEDNTGLAIDGSDVMSTIYNTTIGDSVESVAVGGADPTPASEWKTKTIVQALDTILFPTILASISTLKAISLAVSGVNGIVEIGTTVARTLTATFNDGQIENGDGTTGPDLVGAATQYTFTGTGISSTPQVGNTLAISNTVVSGSNNWAVTVNHSVGTGLYYDNKGVSGVNLDEFRVAGSITDTTSSPTITGRYQQFFGISNTAPANSAEVRSLSNSNFTNTNSFVTPVFSNLSFVIAIPATRNLVSVVTSNNENITGNFSLNTFNVNDAGGTPVSYKVYTFTSVTPLGVTATVTLSGS